MDGGAWWAAVHGVTKSGMTERLHFHFSLSCVGEGNGNPLQYSSLENPMDRGAWWAAGHGVTKSDTTEQLHFRFSLSCTGEGNGNPLQCSCLGESQGQRSLLSCGLWGRTESDTTEATLKKKILLNSSTLVLQNYSLMYRFSNYQIHE